MVREKYWRLLSWDSNITTVSDQDFNTIASTRAMQSKYDLQQHWNEFCEQLKASGDLILRDEVPVSDRIYAEGIRYLTRLLRAGLERSIEYADRSFPDFYSLSHETIKIGSDNPDNIYRNAAIDPALTYRISGKVGNALLLSFASKSDGYSTSGTMAPTGEIFIDDMLVGSDGEFELIASVERQSGNWLPLTKASSMILVRETHGRWEKRVPAEVAISAVNGRSRPVSLSTEALATALRETTQFVQGTSTLFADWMREFKKLPNDWTVVNQENWQAIGGDSNIFYLWGYWELSCEEALVIEVTPPECDYWNFQVNNYWDESLDYRYFQIHQNSETAALNDDGSVTLVLSHDSGIHRNYSDTTGLESGAMMWRWVGASEFPIPTCRKVKACDIKQHI